KVRLKHSTPAAPSAPASASSALLTPLSGSIKEAARAVGVRAAREMAEKIPEMIINDKKIDVPEPVHPKKPFFFFSDFPFFD
ncbi:MAG: hypothetical protein ABSG42_05880, partial [Nitrospirota bacterium]